MNKKYVIMSEGLKTAYIDGEYTTKEGFYVIKIFASELGGYLHIISDNKHDPDYTINLKDIRTELKELISLGLL